MKGFALQPSRSLHLCISRVGLVPMGGFSMLVKVLVENGACSPEFGCEHGLSLYLETGGLKILMDAGQGTLFLENAREAGRSGGGRGPDGIVPRPLRPRGRPGRVSGSESQGPRLCAARRVRPTVLAGGRAGGAGTSAWTRRSGITRRCGCWTAIFPSPRIFFCFPVYPW